MDTVSEALKSCMWSFLMFVLISNVPRKLTKDMGRKTCNHGTWEAEAGGFWIQRELELYTRTLSQSKYKQRGLSKTHLTSAEPSRTRRMSWNESGYLRTMLAWTSDIWVCVRNRRPWRKLKKDAQYTRTLLNSSPEPNSPLQIHEAKSGMGEVLENKYLLICMKYQGLNLERCVPYVSILLLSCIPTLCFYLLVLKGRSSYIAQASHKLYSRQGLTLRGSYLSTLSSWA